MSYYEMVYGTNMFGNPSTSYFNAINGVTPIVVTTVGNTATISHADSGVTPGTYNYGGFTVNAKGHITAATFAPVPMYNLTVQDEGVLVDTTQTMNFTGVGVTVTDVAGVATVNIPGASSGPVWQPLTQGSYYGYDGSSVNTLGVGYNVHVDPAAEQSILIGQDGYLRANASLAVAIGDVADAGNEEDIAIGANATTGNDAGTRRTAIGSLVSITTSDSTTGVGSRLSCTTSANTCLYGASTTSSNSPTAAAFGKGITLTNATNAAVVGQGTSVTAVDSSGLGQGQTIANTNCVVFGKGATTTTNNEVAFGTQTTLRMPSLSQASSGTATYPLLWNSSTKVITADNALYLASWASYTPTYTNLSKGNGVVEARYNRLGGLGLVYIQFTIGGSTSITGAFDISLPAVLSTSPTQAYSGTAGYYDSDVTTYSTGLCYPQGNNNKVIPVTTAGVQWNATTPITWAAGDIFYMQLWYRV